MGGYPPSYRAAGSLSRFLHRFRSPVLRSNGSLRNLKILEVPVADGAPVFTDDLAPIEEMTRKMLAAR